MSQKIDNIFIYCDRWCSRCSYASRCDAYAFNEGFQSELSLPDRDNINKKFWNSLISHYPEVEQSIKDKALLLQLNLDEFEGLQVRSGYNLFQSKVVRSELLSAVRNYEDRVDDWLDEQASAGKIQIQDITPGSVFQCVPDQWPKENIQKINEYLSVIIRYQLLIFLKLSSAYLQKSQEAQNEKEEDTPDPQGSVKTVLEMVSRSLVSFSFLKQHFTDSDVCIEEIMIHLYRMIRKLEMEFPSVHHFRRIGLDET